MPDLPKATNKDGLKDKKEDEVEIENDEEEACMLECREGIGQTSRDVYEEEEDDGMTDIEEEIDLETERRIRGVSHNLLKQLYQEGVQEVDLLGESSGRSLDYYVLYGTPKRKVRVPHFEKYGSPPKILPPYRLGNPRKGARGE
ncbi:hypothetical protein Adt_12009 [Abeliophyllum distichum]|uniref:Uncharacterized protein n=1 Tax=Abeliophyllum distichum TaxID=126358 RepID=A0ABD1UQY3_9LAMI